MGIFSKAEMPRSVSSWWIGWKEQACSGLTLTLWAISRAHCLAPARVMDKNNLGARFYGKQNFLGYFCNVLTHIQGGKASPKLYFACKDVYHLWMLYSHLESNQSHFNDISVSPLMTLTFPSLHYCYLHAEWPMPFSPSVNFPSHTHHLTWLSLHEMAEAQLLWVYFNPSRCAVLVVERAKAGFYKLPIDKSIPPQTPILKWFKESTREWSLAFATVSPAFHSEFPGLAVSSEAGRVWESGDRLWMGMRSVSRPTSP